MASTNKNPNAISQLLGDDSPLAPQKISKAKSAAPAKPEKPAKPKLVPFSAQITEENAQHFAQYLYYAPGESTGKKVRTLNKALADFFKANAEHAYKKIPE